MIVNSLSPGMRLGRVGEDGNGTGDNVYPPNLRPEEPAPALEGLAYPQHRPKSPPNLHHGLATLAHAAFNRNPIHYPNSSQLSPSSAGASQASQASHSPGPGHSSSHARSRPPSVPYTPLPRADIKINYASYFTDSKPPMASTKVCCPSSDAV